MVIVDILRFGQIPSASLFFRYNSAAFVHVNENATGDVSELADEHDLGSCAERREGSIPSVPIYNLSLRAETTYIK